MDLLEYVYDYHKYCDEFEGFIGPRLLSDIRNHQDILKRMHERMIELKRNQPKQKNPKIERFRKCHADRIKIGRKMYVKHSGKIVPCEIVSKNGKLVVCRVDVMPTISLNSWQAKLDCPIVSESSPALNRTVNDFYLANEKPKRLTDDDLIVGKMYWVSHDGGDMPAKIISKTETTLLREARKNRTFLSIQFVVQITLVMSF